MDAVDAVLTLLGICAAGDCILAVLAYRYRRAALIAQREVVLLVALSHSTAGYDTGLDNRGLAAETSQAR